MKHLGYQWDYNCFAIVSQDGHIIKLLHASDCFIIIINGVKHHTMIGQNHARTWVLAKLIGTAEDYEGFVVEEY